MAFMGEATGPVALWLADKHGWAFAGSFVFEISRSRGTECAVMIIYEAC